jgi:hypothetical protein
VESLNVTGAYARSSWKEIESSEDRGENSKRLWETEDLLILFRYPCDNFHSILGTFKYQGIRQTNMQVKAQQHFTGRIECCMLCLPLTKRRVIRSLHLISLRWKLVHPEPPGSRTWTSCTFVVACVGFCYSSKCCVQRGPPTHASGHSDAPWYIFRSNHNGNK